jgi:hypothetical protein
MKPKIVTKEQLIAILQDMISHIQQDDSFGGCVEYEAGEEDDNFGVVASYRIGNSEGQGGMRIIDGE